MPRTADIDRSTRSAIDAAIEAERARQQVVGLALGVIREGRVAYLQYYGLADREKGVAVTEKTLFRWASISKTLTAVTAMQLVDEGRLDLNRDVRRYVPEFPDEGEPVTSRQLLCHQGGIVHYSNGKVIRTQREYGRKHPFESVILALDTFKESPLIARPGEKHSYTTHGYILLSAVIERAGKMRFADQVRARIVRPLGLETLRPDYQWERIAHRAVGYRLGQGKVVRSTDTDVSWKLGGGGFLSNAADMARYATALIKGRLVSKASERAMWTRQRLRSGEGTSRGLGFVVETQNGTLKISHNGAQEKTRTRMVLFPRQRHGMVVLSNSENAKPGAFTTAAYRAIEALKE